MRERFDAAVIGAGPAGAAAALCLARSGARVALVEMKTGRGVTPGESLPPAAGALFEKLELSGLLEVHARSAGGRVTWGDARAASNPSVFSPYGSGWHLERPRFDAQI